MIRRVGLWMAAGLLAAAGMALGQQGIDYNRAQQLYQRAQRGERLSPADQAYLERAIAARQKQELAAQTRQAAANMPHTRPSTGMIPLTDLKAGQTYKGESGGLYGAGSNDPPAEQWALAQAAAKRITLLDAAGKESAHGKIVLLSIGMSNTTQEFSRFKEIADRDSSKSPLLTIVDGAQGGQDAQAWTRLPPSASPVWDAADQRLRAAGVTPLQVQVVWIKQALIQQGQLGEFPAHAKALQKELHTIATMTKGHYPNVQLAYLSSRIYAGYAMTALNPEPYAYEGAFSIRWLIQDQMNGMKELNADPAKGDVKAPVLLWGPYLWADGVKGRKADKLVYKREDFEADGTHPSASGREKVAELLLNFFKTDATTKDWFVHSQ